MKHIKVQAVIDEAKKALSSAPTIHELTEIRYTYLGKKGSVTALLKQIPSLPVEERPGFGRDMNDAKVEIESFYQECRAVLAKESEALSRERLDLTLPGYAYPEGSIHPISRLIHEVEEIFSFLGFEVVWGPDLETEFHNFDALNVPADHPARDMHDTFYIKEGMVLRTHTSNVQIRVMKNVKPPIRIISPGRCYRNDTPDASHAQIFHQVEGLYVDKHVTFADLKYTLAYFVKRIFGPEVRVRFRPSYFPFTEPSAEYDVSCIMCKGAGCRVCKHTGWLEISGAGMVNPKVFENVGYTEPYTGFAFGMGIERIAMLKYGISDIRKFMENDERFLRQLP